MNQAIESWLNIIASKDILIKGFTASLPESQLHVKIDFFSVSSFFLLNFLLFYLEGGISRTEGRYEETEIKGIEMQVLNDTHKKQ